MTYQLHHGDCLNIMPLIERESVDAIVTDPPYGLGFMGKDWDHGVPGEHFWREAYRCVKPGAYLLAFGGTRTFHRLAVAIEDAGWEIRDTVMWVYGQGFPKSHDVSKAIDKNAPRFGMFEAFGAHFTERRIASRLTQKQVAKHFPSKTGGLTGCVWNWENGANVPTRDQWNILAPMLGLSDEWLPLIERIEAEREVIGRRDGSLLAVAPGQNNDRSATTLDITSPATPAAAEWDGWGTALKPAWEPILVARKPLQGTVAENVQRYGTGAMNIDGCRIGTERNVPASHSKNNGSIGAIGRVNRLDDELNPNIGRWPANLIHDGSAEVLAGFPMTTQNGYRANPSTNKSTWFGANDGSHIEGERGFNDTGNAARFFYCAKASKADRDEGLEGFEDSIGHSAYGDYNGTEEHATNKNGAIRNHHPTVKPTSLMRYLCRLVTPPNGTILDPFMGSGSTGKAAMLEGFNFIGIDTEIEYVEIAARRIEHACEKVGIVIEQPMMFETQRETVDRPKQLILL